MNSAYSIFRSYGTSRSIKKDLIIYGTARPRRKFANENPMPLLGQVRKSWLSMAPLGYVESTKMQKLLESKNRNKKENQNQNESKNENSSFNSFLFFIHFLFSFSFLYSFYFAFSFSFSLLLLFSFLFFIFVFVFVFIFVFFSFVFLVFLFKFYYGTSRPPYFCAILRMASYIEYNKIRVENFYLYLLIM